MNNFNNISCKNDFADFLEIPLKKLTYILYIKKPDSYYTSFTIPKKNDDPRNINAPTGDLKDLQRKLADALWEFQKELVVNKKIHTNVSHSFEKEKGIITNAKIHVNKRYVLNLDLENFFESFHFGRVRGYFEKNQNFNLPLEVATIIAQLTCYKGLLPQGAPSSPIITNLICNILDMRLIKVGRKFKLDYTRYADDLTFSTNDKHFLDNKSKFYKELKNEIERFGLSINNKKTRLSYIDSRQEVTGLVVNEKINIDRQYYKTTRAMANHLYTHGKFMINDIQGEINQLEGRFAFINQLDYYNNKNLGFKKRNLWDLNSREKEYQKFIFYKYFFLNPEPLIITEGKTDIIYLKAAIKKYYKDYPRLIEKKEEQYKYKISFLKKTKRLKYFLHLPQDGADAMRNIYNLYSGKNNFPNLTNYFVEKSKVVPKNPVVLIFDNEQESDRPLKKFKNCIGLNEKLDLSKHIVDNLYVLTNPLIQGLKECEFEDLFEESLLCNKLNGKEFSRKDKFDKEKYYGKSIFSNYVFRNYNIISFDNFKPLLDELDKIINNYERNL